jgi:hypothetical protein
MPQAHSLVFVSRQQEIICRSDEAKNGRSELKRPSILQAPGFVELGLVTASTLTVAVQPHSSHQIKPPDRYLPPAKQHRRSSKHAYLRGKNCSLRGEKPSCQRTSGHHRRKNEYNQRKGYHPEPDGSSTKKTTDTRELGQHVSTNSRISRKSNTNVWNLPGSHRCSRRYCNARQEHSTGQLD